MGIQLSSYKASIDFFKMVSYKSNEYFLKGKWVGAPMKKVPTNNINTLMMEGLVVEQKDLGNNQACSIVKKDAVERFHPNNINNKDFWVECRKSFPLVSVCGGSSKNIKEANEKTLKMSKDVGLLPFLNSLIEKSPEKLNILEIGFGYGNLFFEIKDKCTYTGIDYVIPKSLRKYKNFIEIDESGIPDYLLDEKYFDVIYSVNVFQHCSQKDRFKYFMEGYRALKKGGYFIFTQFLRTEKNKNDACWGVADENGRYYTQFFNQLTECDWDYELYNYLNGVGFEPVKGYLGGNFYAMIIRKK